MWEKEKLLITSNFSFSHNVFKRLVSQRRQKVLLCGNGSSYVKVLDTFLLYLHKTNVSGVYWNRPLCLSVCVSLCPSVYKILASVKTLAGILSHT